MSRETWDIVDRYINDTLVGSDPVLEAAVQSCVEAGLPEIAVTPNQGKLLHLLALATGAGRVLEIGTLGGYSAIWLGRALPPDGRLVTLEADPKHAEIARESGPCRSDRDGGDPPRSGSRHVAPACRRR